MAPSIGLAPFAVPNLNLLMVLTDIVKWRWHRVSTQMVSQAFHWRTANLFATGSDGTFIERYVEMLPLSIHAPSGDRDEGFDLVVVGEFADSVIEMFCRLISHLYRIFVGGRV